jgi:hypothetical protein
MFEKLKYALSMLDSNDLLSLLIALAIYHAIILICLFLFVRGFMKLRILSLESELKEYKKNWEGRDGAWRDRENELRRILHVEKEREISQLKAEYDSCITLLEQKLMRSRSKGV